MMQTRFSGNIETVRAIEDCIRATKKYTEGINTMRRHHPIQGEEFVSKAFSKYYEVYPEMEISWNMPVNTALDWLFSDTPCINMVFFYDYRNNSAYVRVDDGEDAVKALVKHIPRIGDALDKATEADKRNRSATEVKDEKEADSRFPTHIHIPRAVK